MTDATSQPNEAQPWRAALVARLRVEAQPPEKFSHQARLYVLARAIADAEAGPVDDDVLFGAAWAHDLGVFLGHRPEEPEALKLWNSTDYTVAHAGPLLAACGFPPEKIAAAVECIRTHGPHGEPSTLEGIVIRDADLLEQIGAVAVMRTTAKIAQDTRFITFADAAASLRRALETVPAKIRTDHARQLAVPRIAALAEFFFWIRWTQSRWASCVSLSPHFPVRLETLPVRSEALWRSSGLQPAEEDRRERGFSPGEVLNDSSGAEAPFFAAAIQGPEGPCFLRLLKRPCLLRLPEAPAFSGFLKPVLSPAS